MWDAIEKRIRGAMGELMVGLYAKITSVVKADNTVFIKLSEQEEIRNVRIVTPYGLYSLPTPDVYGQVIFNNSIKKASLVGVEDSGVPLVLDIGEVIFYNKVAGSYIHLKNDGKVYIKGLIVNV